MENYPGFIPQPEKQFRYSELQVVICLAAVALGLVFKLQHYPGSALLILAGSGAFTGYNFMAIVLLRGKHMMNNIQLGVGTVWLLILVWGVIANGGHPYNGLGLGIHAGAIILGGGINALVAAKYINKSV